MKAIRIDGEGDGRWIMDLVPGSWDPKYDHSFCAVRDGQRLGGFVLTGYSGPTGSVSVHMAGADKHWCSRDLMWMCFDFAFNVLGVTKMIATVPSTNTTALALDLRAGWRIETVVRDAIPGGHMILLEMRREHCPWLNVVPKGYKRTQK